MATSKLKIYYTHLTPTRNAWVDDIEGYLTSLEALVPTKLFYSNATFQYQKFANELEIVINTDQEDLSKQEVGNYVRFEQDSQVWYYFVMSYEWRSTKSLKLKLSIDSVNTFMDDLTFSNKTVIERQHSDRFVKWTSGMTKMLRVFDPENEEIPVNQYKVKDDKILQNNVNLDWYLIYKTNKDASVAEDNPVSCFCIANQSLIVSKTGGGASQTLYPSDLSFGQYNYVLAADNPDFSFTFNYTRVLRSGAFVPTSSTQTVNIVEGGEFMIPEYTTTEMYGVETIVRATEQIYTVDNIKFMSDGSDIFMIVYGTFKETGDVHNGNPALGVWTPTFTGYIAEAVDTATTGNYLTINELNFTRLSYDGSIPMQYAQQLISTTMTYNIGTQVTRSTTAYSAVDKTDAKIIKIIRLPYAPVTVTYNEGTGVYTFPDGWTYNSGYMQLNDASLSSEFESFVKDISLQDYAVQSLLSVPDRDDNRKIEDPKILTSQFSTFKINYDSFAQEFKWEEFILKGVNTSKTTFPQLPVYFKPTNTINSKFAFKMDIDDIITEGGDDCKWKSVQDYAQYLLISRNNEETIFSSDYLNYIRNGYNYDKKVKADQAAMSYFMGGLQVVGAAIGFAASAFTGGASAAAGVALATGAITTFASAAYNQDQGEKSISQKLKSLQMQAVGVSGTDDIDLLKYYNDNKLHFMVYKPLEYQLNALNNLFHYCGYKHKAMAVPDTTSRQWFNFIQCKPVFVEEETNVQAPYNEFLDDLKARFIAGVTRYHRANSNGYVYDWAQEKENWETWAVRFEISDLSVNYATEGGMYYDTTHFWGNWYGPELNGTSQYLQVCYYETEADWDEQDPNDTDNIDIQNGEFDFSYNHQGLYKVTFQIVDTTDIGRTSPRLQIDAEDW